MVDGTGRREAIPAGGGGDDEDNMCRVLFGAEDESNTTKNIGNTATNCSSKKTPERNTIFE